MKIYIAFIFIFLYYSSFECFSIEFMNDTSFIDRLILKDERAFEELYQKNNKKVLNICYRFANNQDIAEELTQEVFIEVFSSIRKFKKNSKISTWIYRIAVNKSIDYVRSRKSKKRFGFVTSIDDTESHIQEIKSDSSNPEERFQESERKKILDKALLKIPEKQRVALVLSKYNELTQKEVAEILGTSVSSVESMISRGKKNLEKKLEKYFKKYVF